MEQIQRLGRLLPCESQPLTMISKEALEEYKTIYKAQFGKDVSDADALEQAINLLTFMNAIYRPIKKEWLEELEESDRQKKL